LFATQFPYLPEFPVGFSEKSLKNDFVNVQAQLSLFAALKLCPGTRTPHVHAPGLPGGGATLLTLLPKMKIPVPDAVALLVGL
jgi:hypothetical protein